jgi:hypothetical protein
LIRAMQSNSGDVMQQPSRFLGEISKDLIFPQYKNTLESNRSVRPCMPVYNPQELKWVFLKM